MTRSLRFLACLALVTGVLFGLASRAGAQNSSLLIVPKKADPNQLIALSFQDAPIDDVLRFLADASGKLVFKDSNVSTSITIRNQGRIKVAEAIRLIQTILAFKGYALVETPDAIFVTSNQDAKTRVDTPIGVGKDITQIPTGKGIVTWIFPLQNVDAVRLQQELLPLFPATTTTMIANGETNSLVVVDQADTVRRIAQIINQLDRNLVDEITVEVIHLKYADANEVARYLTDLFRPDDAAANGAGAGNNANRPGGFQPGQGFPGGPGGPGGAGGGAANQRGSLAQLRGRVKFAADVRSNSLIVYASPANLTRIRELIAQIDVTTVGKSEYRIVPLKYADASSLSDSLNQLLDPTLVGGRRQGGFFGFGGGGAPSSTANSQAGIQEYRVVPDVRTNSLIITAPTDSVEALVSLVRQLDTPTEVESVVRVFQLNNAIASEVATTLRSLFQGTTTNGGVGGFLFGAGNNQIPANSPLDLLRRITIVPNDQTNQILVSGPAQTFPTIERLLAPGQGLDKQQPQVFIEVVIADITLDDLTKYGIEFNAVSGSSTFGTNFGLTSPTPDPSTGFSYSVVSSNFQATFRALTTTNKLKIVSSPHVMVTDNSPALITIGESIPYAGQTTITSGLAQTSTAFQDVSITLNVTPHISPGDHILMDIDQVVNSLIEFVTVAPGQTAPRTTNRRAGTTVIVGDDQTVVLGGIIGTNQSKTVNKVPILGDLPVIGNLFRNTTRDKSRTELVVFITPHIVRDVKGADAIRQYERDRLQVDPLKVLKAPFSKPLDLKPEDLRHNEKRNDSTTPDDKNRGQQDTDDKKRGKSSKDKTAKSDPPALPVSVTVGKPRQKLTPVLPSGATATPLTPIIKPSGGTAAPGNAPAPTPDAKPAPTAPPAPAAAQ